MDFSIKGEYLNLKIDNVSGYPNSTSPFGGYDTNSIIEIKTGNYIVHGSC